MKNGADYEDEGEDEDDLPVMVAAFNSFRLYSAASFFMMARRKLDSTGVGYGMLQFASWIRTSWARSVSCSFVAIKIGMVEWWNDGMMV